MNPYLGGSLQEYSPHNSFKSQNLNLVIALYTELRLHAILIVLELSSAFDNVRQNILIYCLSMLASVIWLWNSSSVICYKGPSLLGCKKPPPPALLSFVGSNKGRLQVPFYLLYTCYPWGKSFVDMILIFIATRMLYIWMLQQSTDVSCIMSYLASYS